MIVDKRLHVGLLARVNLPSLSVLIAYDIVITIAYCGLHWRFVSLPNLPLPLTLVAAERDRAVPPQVAVEAKGLLRDATLIRVPGLGHLAHEEQPGRFAEIILSACV